MNLVETAQAIKTGKVSLGIELAQLELNRFDHGRF